MASLKQDPKTGWSTGPESELDHLSMWHVAMALGIGLAYAVCALFARGAKSALGRED